MGTLCWGCRLRTRVQFEETTQIQEGRLSQREVTAFCPGFPASLRASWCTSPLSVVSFHTIPSKPPRIPIRGCACKFPNPQSVASLGLIRLMVDKQEKCIPSIFHLDKRLEMGGPFGYLPSFPTATGAEGSAPWLLGNATRLLMSLGCSGGSSGSFSLLPTFCFCLFLFVCLKSPSYQETPTVSAVTLPYEKLLALVLSDLFLLVSGWEEPCF